MVKGRPPLYKTEDERKQANRDKSKRSYDKRKDRINRRKCERRRELNPELALTKPLPPLAPKPRTKNKASPVEVWLKFTDKIPGKFQELLCNRPPSEFLTNLVRKFEIHHRNNDPEEVCRADIEHYLEKIGELQKKLSLYFDRFLNTVGLGKETSHVNEIAADIRRVELSLQDVLTNILSDPDAVARQIRLGRLTFA